MINVGKNILVRWGDIRESRTGEEFDELVLAREDAAVEQGMYFPQLLALVYVEPVHVRSSAPSSNARGVDYAHVPDLSYPSKVHWPLKRWRDAGEEREGRLCRNRGASCEFRPTGVMVDSFEVRGGAAVDGFDIMETAAGRQEPARPFTLASK